ncbi:HK97 gp10 family phage protein [Pokkaliibacter sp. MBI-7]|uniref:HK97 gp10 family phage protein n=1 Tax=Pokkaliibacter sp. MBI-7 TaxID=3040600 RepID=UPI002446C95D|nr:HK97 gp10 family phage protein [Pokkaliibacter sp. MBI-7]MDH2435596.1 HK97 gp10 family phage protein [Pokkaliibacter sp. MBI-7]
MSLELHYQQQISQALDDLEAGLRDKAIKAGLRYAAQPVTRAMRQTAPVKDGELKRAITSRTLTPRTAQKLRGFTLPEIGAGKAGVAVGPLRKVGGYAQDYIGSLNEHGVEAGIRRRSRRKTRQIAGQRKRVLNPAYNRFYFHPGQRATWFMRRALNAADGQILPRFYQGLQRYLQKQRSEGPP